MRTQCPHCKSKFRSPDGSTGKKAKCPKCKQLFVISPVVKADIVDVCSNCGKEIVKLEQVCVFDSKIVCVECDKKIRSDSKPEVSDSTERDVAALAEASSQDSNKITDAEVCKILGVGDAIGSRESEFPKSPVQDSGDMEIVTCQSCLKKIRRKDKALWVTSEEGLIICKECEKKEKKLRKKVEAIEKRAYRPSYSAFGGPIGKIVFVLMIFIGIPLFKTCTSELRYKLSRPHKQPMNTSVEPSSEDVEDKDSPDERFIVGLPQDATYGTQAMKEGIYTDPIHGFLRL